MSSASRVEGGVLRERAVLPPLSAALGVAALADQASFAGAHLLLNLLLARWLPAAGYGAFAQAYALLLVGLALHSAFLTEPLLVYGRRSFEGAFARYLGVVLWGHLALCLVFGAALLLGLAGAGAGGALREAGEVVAVAAPALFLVPLLRRACSVRMAWSAAAMGGVLYALSLAALLELSHARGVLSAGSALAGLALASLVASAWIALRLGCRPRFASGGAFAGQVARKHWQYGRWALVAVLATWIPWNLHYLILARLLPLEEIGALRALQNLLMPTTHLSMALCTMLLPLLAAHLSAGRLAEARALSARHAAGVAAANAAYVISVWLFGEPLLGWVYGGAYAPYYPLAAQAAAISGPWSVVAALALGQQALGRSARALALWLPYVALSLGLGVWGATQDGVAGCVRGMLLASLLALPLAWLVHRRWCPWRGTAG